MKKYLINYADQTYYKSQKQNTESALKIGGFDEVISYGVKDLDQEFKDKNKFILDHKRGAGFWIWKPYIILKTLEKINEGDLLFYSDAGCVFIRDIDPIIEILDSTDEKLLLFEIEDIHTIKQWTKRDCLVYMGLDKEPYLSYPQFLGGFSVMRKNSFVMSFVKEWLEYAQDPRIITDIPNECGLDNYPEFKDHRHDQSIVSLLGRKHNIPYIPDLSQWGNDRNVVPQTVYLHRNRI
jgi:hypothetical protein